MNRIGDQTLMLYADGELGALRRGEVEQALALDAGLRSRLERDRRLRALLAAHYGAVGNEPVPPRLTALVTGAAAPMADRRRWWVAAALAASFLLAWIVVAAL